MGGHNNNVQILSLRDLPLRTDIYEHFMEQPRKSGKKKTDHCSLIFTSLWLKKLQKW